MVKQTLIGVGVAVVVVAVAVGSAAHYNQYKNKQVAAAQSAAKVSADQATATKKKQAEFLQEFKHVQSECSRAAQAWNVIPASIRTRIPAPDCAVTQPLEP